MHYWETVHHLEFSDARVQRTLSTRRSDARQEATCKRYGGVPRMTSTDTMTGMLRAHAPLFKVDTAVDNFECLHNQFTNPNFFTITCLAQMGFL